LSTFVLVAGGWRGGWALSPLARTLRALGHDVFTPTLTGLGERAHLAYARPNLDTHIVDIANVLDYENLTDVVLCGYSYAGMVITGVADRLPERIAALVYVDAFVPDDGDSWWELAGDYFRKIAIEGPASDGFSVPPPPGRDPRVVAHLFATFRQTIRLTGRWQEVREKIFIYASGWENTPFRPTYEKLKGKPEWIVKSLATGHDVLLTATEDFIEIIGELDAMRKSSSSTRTSTELAGPDAGPAQPKTAK